MLELEVSSSSPDWTTGVCAVPSFIVSCGTIVASSSAANAPVGNMVSNINVANTLAKNRFFIFTFLSEHNIHTSFKRYELPILSENSMISELRCAYTTMIYYPDRTTLKYGWSQTDSRIIGCIHWEYNLFIFIPPFYFYSL